MDEQMRNQFEAWLAKNPDARFWNTTDGLFAAFIGGAALSQPAAQGPLTDAQIDALWTQQVNLPQKVQRRVIARAIESAHGIA